MAFPIVVDRTETPFTSAGDPLIPFTQTTGDLVVIFLSIATAQTITVDDGFTNLTNVNANFHIIYKILDGSEGGNVQVTLGTNAKAAAIAYNIQGYHPSQAPQISTVATGTSTSPNATTVTPTGGAKDYLWISAFYMAGEEANDDTWVNSAPTNFTNLLQVTSGTASTAATNCEVASAEFTSNAASMDAGAFSTDQSLAWRAYTLAVHPDPITITRIHAQAQAKIVRILNVSAQAIALITRGGDSKVIDTFTRTVSNGLGSADTGGAWTLISGTAADFDVNGTEATIQSRIDETKVQQLESVLLNKETGVSFAFDFKLSILPNTNNFDILNLFAGIASTSTQDSGWRLLLRYNVDVPDFLELSLGLDITAQNAGGNSILQSPVADTWYRVEGTIVTTSGGQRRARSKIYAVGSPNAYAFRSDAITDKPKPGHASLRSASRLTGNNTPLISIDNLTITDSGWTESGQAQALISNIRLVNEASNTNAGPSTSLSVPITTPTAGNLLIAGVASDKNAGVYTYPSGFTPLNESISTSVSSAMAYKIAAGNETTIDWSQTGTATAGMSAWVGEYSGVDTLDVKAEATTDETVVTSRSTGTTAATSFVEELAIAMMGVDTALSVDAGRAWSNGFVEENFVSLLGSGSPGLGVAWK
jgi:hypothetical protein